MERTIDKLRSELNKRPPATAVYRDPKVASGQPWLKADYVDAEANRIFGPDGWSYEVLETSIDHHLGLAVARVKVTIHWPGGATTSRTDVGARPPAFPKKPSDYGIAEAWEHALKAAATDARKNALRSLGHAFGLDLAHDAVKPATSRASRQGQDPEEALAEVSGSGTRRRAPNGVVEVSAEGHVVNSATGEVLDPSPSAFWTLYNGVALAAGVPKQDAAALAQTAAANGDWLTAIAALQELIQKAK